MSNYTIEQALDFRQKIFDRLPSLETDGQCGIPNQRFWDFYREKKDFFFAACIYVRKDKNTWYIFAGAFKDRHKEACEQIQTWTQNYSSECPDCRKRCDIECSLTSNKVYRYRFLCRSCGRIPSTGLPHKYVEHCVESLGFKVFMRPDDDCSAYFQRESSMMIKGRWVRVPQNHREVNVVGKGLRILNPQYAPNVENLSLWTYHTEQVNFNQPGKLLQRKEHCDTQKRCVHDCLWCGSRYSEHWNCGCGVGTFRVSTSNC